MQDADLEKRIAAGAPIGDVTEEALQLLVLLGHKRTEAERLVSEALAAEPTAPDAEAIVRIIYRKQQEKN